MGIIGSAIGSIITTTLPEPILVGVLEPFLIYLIIISSLKIHIMRKNENLITENKKLTADENLRKSTQ